MPPQLYERATKQKKIELGEHSHSLKFTRQAKLATNVQLMKQYIMSCRGLLVTRFTSIAQFLLHVTTKVQPLPIK